MLTTKQRQFAYAMVHAGTIEAAAKAAEITIEIAEQWLVDPDIEAVIFHDKVAAVNTATETRERVIARYAAIANADIIDYFEPDTDCAMLRPLNQLTQQQRLSIKKISHTQHGPVLELYDRLRANDKIAEIIGVLNTHDTGESADEKARRIRTLLQEMEDVTTGVTAH